MPGAARQGIQCKSRAESPDAGGGVICPYRPSEFKRLGQRKTDAHIWDRIPVMTAENYILATIAGLVVGWIANSWSKSRYSFIINLFVAIFGAILLNFFVQSTEMMDAGFFSILLISLAGSTVLLGLFHATRALERR
ncbi:MAG: GlsB/YeaQ/YmgE family stress response membrane protein [Asticcacaulis sp.]